MQASDARAPMDVLDDLAVVAIGRNEGERLRHCLESVANKARLVIYVDSGSTDDSIQVANQLGASVVKLDTDIPFTAARARNAGFRKAMQLQPTLRWVQFVDGDCEVRADWLSVAREYLTHNEQTAAVSGRRRERYPTRSIYNEICDIEWETEPGPAKYCGGDVMLRADALSEVGGYRDGLIAGEEPELCVRLRERGWKINVLADEMTLHDADMTRFSQWWNRVKRCGWAYAAGVHLHGGAPEYHWVWQAAQAWIWVFGPFAFGLVLLALIGPSAALVLLIYPLQWTRLYLRLPGTRRRRAVAAFAYTVGRFAEFVGQIKYWYQHWTGQTAVLIEYK